MATSICDYSVADFNNELQNQNSTIKLAIVEHAAFNDPYSNVLLQDTFSSGYGEQQIYSATPRTAMNQSTVRPVATRFSESCQTNAPVAKWGTEQYTSYPGIIPGESIKICLKQQYFVVERQLDQAIDMLKQGITELVSNDIRANLLDLSGMKFVVPSPGGVPEAGLTGSEWAVSTNFNGNFPGDRLTFQYAKWLRDTIAYTFRPPMFGKGPDAHAILITSYELNDALRTDAPVNNSLTAASQGSFKDGKDALWAYAFIDTNFRGLKLAIDPNPLRFNGLNAQGNPVLIEQYLQVAAGSTGLTWKTNPAWQYAAYEVSFMLFAKNAFARLTPKDYSGEGAAKFPTGMFGGELKWLNPIESCNPWGDFGWFQYRIVRAFQPMAPHYVAAIISKRCRSGFTDNTATCTDISDLTV